MAKTMSKAEQKAAKEAEEQAGATHTDGEPNGNGDGEGDGNGGSIAARAEAPEMPEISPQPLGPGGTIPLPKMPGRRQPPTNIKVKITEAHCEGAGQLEEESEYLLVVRGRYKNATTTPKFDGDGQVISRDYVQTMKPTWVEEFDAFLASNGWKIVAVDDLGEPIHMSSLTAIEERRREQMAKEGALD
jgi:hypothetical protein